MMSLASVEAAKEIEWKGHLEMATPVTNKIESVVPTSFPAKIREEEKYAMPLTQATVKSVHHRPHRKRNAEKPPEIRQLMPAVLLIPPATINTPSVDMKESNIMTEIPTVVKSGKARVSASRKSKGEVSLHMTENTV